jgi:hypothetical protein
MSARPKTSRGPWGTLGGKKHQLNWVQGPDKLGGLLRV